MCGDVLTRSVLAKTFIGVYLMIGVYLTGVYLMGVYLIGVHLIGVYLMGVHHRMQPFLLSRTYVFAAFGGPGLMPHFSFRR